MILTDVVLLAGLAVFLAAWWIRRTPRRPQVLLVAAGLAAAAGLLGVLDDRWQDGFGLLAAVAALLVLLINRLRRTNRVDGLPWLSGLLFTALTGLALALIVLFPILPLPKPRGPEMVGVRTFEVVDASRPGVFAAGPGAPRRLLVRVWYPAGGIGRGGARHYFGAREARSTGRSVGELFGFPPFFTHLKHVPTLSWPDAPLKSGAKGLPVVFYSHGYTSFLGQNTVLMEHLASHGYVVFSVQHTYDSAATLFLDGTVAPADPELAAVAEEQAEGDLPRSQVRAIAGKTLDERLGGWIDQRLEAQRDRARILRSGEVWLQDRIFLHDQLQAGAVPAPIREIAAAGDLTRVGEMGMSFGGAISGSICVVDPRCGAGINLDGGDFPFHAFATPVRAPFLMFHSDLEALYRELEVKDAGPLHSFNEFSYEGFTGPSPPVYRLMLKDTAHLGLSDFSLFMRRPLRDRILGQAPAGVMIGAQNDFVLGFFDRHLRGRANGFPGPQLKAHAGWVAPMPDSGVRRWWAAKSEAERAAIQARIAKARLATAP